MEKQRHTLKIGMTINNLSMEWNESSRRAGKKCVGCGMPTRGRLITEVVQAAHASCAMTLFIDKALRVYGVKAS